MPLSDTAIRAAKPRDKAYKMADGGGLALLVKPNGSKLWRMRYRHAGIEKMLSFGMYPNVSVKLARTRRDEARRQLAQNEDPGAERKAERDARGNTLPVIGLEWFELQSNPPENSGITPARLSEVLKKIERSRHPGNGSSSAIASESNFSICRSNRARESRHNGRSAWSAGPNCCEKPGGNHRAPHNR
jgi:hypothetical protein